jgi:glutamate-ammonia-ligase adenylyltransferase
VRHTATVLLDAPAVVEACERSADPALARRGLRAVEEARPDAAEELAGGGRLLEAVVAVACASDSLVGAIAADPAMLGAIRDEPLDGERDEHAFLRAASAVLDDDDPLRELRRWKRREMLRIAARDLLGLADLRSVGRELAGLARACLEVAVRIADPALPFAVVGMGKLGGRELNYASDVDVLFVHDGDPHEGERAARAVLQAMAGHTDHGYVFRTDANLRPEGRSGPLSRSLDAYEAYWDRWAAAWEVQALLKATPAAGDAALATAFSEAASARVWSPFLDSDRIREIRLLKARSEAVLATGDRTERELKRGRGGIRDLEFAVQLLQLVHGRHDESVRSPNTLTGLERLAVGGYLPVADAAALDRAYVWLRTVEHRLQLVHEQQTHTLPADDAARTRIARVLGLRDSAEASAREQFDTRQREEQATVRRIHERLFFAPILDTLAGTGAMPLAAALERLDAFGFRDAEQTRTALRELTAGLTRRSRVMQTLFPVLLGWLSETPDPDLGLLQLRRLAEGYTRSQTLARVFRETPVAAERVCRVLGSSRVLGAALHRQPEFVEAYADADRLGREAEPADLLAEVLDTLDWRDDEAGRWLALRRFKRRQILRIGSRDVLGFADVDAVGRELAGVAEASLVAVLRSLAPDLPFAVVAMGRFGGRELSYVSDLDVMFVYDGAGAAAFESAEQAATRVTRAIGASTGEGATFRIDVGLRPEGSKGYLARSLDGYREYYERWAETWEFQSLLRARVVAGDADVGRRFLELVETFVYRDPLPDGAVRDIRRIKARVERERVPAGEDPKYHLKLGPGSLSDVEFTVQLLQLQHGAEHPEVRTPSTKEALRALAAAGLLDPDDAEILASAYDLCERARARRYLLTATTGDSLPVDTVEAQQLGRLLGFTHAPASEMRDEYRRLTRRARAVVERVFYGRD